MTIRTRSVSEGDEAAPINTQASTRARRPFKHLAELFSIALMLIGVVMVCQPFFHVLFRYGFVVTLAGIIAFTVASNLPERDG